MNSNVERMWWEEDEFHTIEGGKHFIHKGARIENEAAETVEGHMTIQTQIYFAKREECGVLEVPYG